MQTMLLWARTKRVTQCVLFWLGVLAGCSNSFGDNPPSGSIVFFVHDSGGTRLPYGVTEFKNTKTGVELATRFRGGWEAKSILPGRYHYALKRSDLVKPNHSNISGYVSIQGEEVLVQLIAPGVISAGSAGEEILMDFSEGEPIGLTGHIVGYHATVDTWVEITKPFDAIRAVARVKPDGTFKASLSSVGSHVLSMYEDGNIIHARVFSVPQNLKDFDLVVDVPAVNR